MANRTVIFSFFIILSLFISSSSWSGETLSNSEAEKIIRSELNYPKMQEVRHYISAKTFNRMIRDGYFSSSATKCGGAGPMYTLYCREATSKGKPYMVGMVQNPYNKGGPDEFKFVGSIYSLDIKVIKEVLIDEQAKVAVVSYVEGYIQNQPVFDEICRGETDSYCDYGKQSVTTKKIKLKKYDKGWRVMEN